MRNSRASYANESINAEPISRLYLRRLLERINIPAKSSQQQNKRKMCQHCARKVDLTSKADSQIYTFSVPEIRNSSTQAPEDAIAVMSLNIFAKYKTTVTPKIDNIFNLSTFQLNFRHHQDKLTRLYYLYIKSSIYMKRLVT